MGTPLTTATRTPAEIVSATWTFDITGRTNIQLKIDMGMTGDFDADDDFLFEYSIDGGGTQTAFDIQVDEDDVPTFGFTDSGILYFAQMEGGATPDRYFERRSIENNERDLLLALGPWHMDQDPNGDPGDMVTLELSIPDDDRHGTMTWLRNDGMIPG